ncbi:MAG: hypothetical protein JST28_04520 [Acidobacteria bacterium]|nr:hypothetical protein [Acidobacteriota bacterium]
MKFRDQSSEIKDREVDRMKHLLRSALRPVDPESDVNRDLWPAMLRRMDEQSVRGAARVPWFDWALGGALLAFAAVAPRTIPVILYYL